MRNLVEMIFKNAEENPQKPALADKGGERIITYGELKKLSCRYAAFYHIQGLSRNDIIIIAGDRSFEYIAAELGAWIAGCAVAPINANYPQERIDLIKEDCNSPLIMTEALLQKAAAGEPVEDRSCEILIREKDIAFLIYTSGSTGKPKGVYCDYETLSVRSVMMTEELSDDIVLSVVPFYFVAVLENLFAPLCLGNTVHIASTDLMKDIGAIENYIYDHKITRTFLSPQMLRLFHNKSDSLRVVDTGSERVTGFEKGSYLVVNAYGMSETLGPMVRYAAQDGYRDHFPIGTALDGFKVYLLDENLQPVGAGEEGEIVISGAIASGYFNRAEETERTFLKNPFETDARYARMCKTGDIGRLDEQGNLIYVSRKDWMVKINGQRVEPGEIEYLLRKKAEIENAVVKAFTGVSGQTYLCAYYTIKAGCCADTDQLRSYLSAHLASYMIPSFFVPLDVLPINQNGKIDRLALKEPDASTFHKAYQAPTTENEEKLCAAFEEVLQCGRVGIDDDFFAMGGNSINVLMLIAECQIEGLTPTAIFLGKTPAEIAKKIRTSLTDLYAECSEHQEYYTLTDSQMGVYLECDANPDSTMYNIPLVYRASRTDQLNLSNLQSAVQSAIARHPSLSVSLTKVDDMPVMKRDGFPIRVTVTEMDETKATKYLSTFIHPFDLMQEPLCRAEILVTRDNVYLLFDIHHMVFDGTSSTVLIDDVVRGYTELPLEAESITMFQQSEYEKKLELSEEYQKAEEFFEEKLSGIDTDSNLIPDIIIKKEQITGGRTYYTNLLEETPRETIAAYLRSNAVTENTLFLSAFAYTLAKFSNQEDVLFCTVNNGRHDTRLNRTVGMLVRTLPIHLTIKEENTSAAFLQTTQQYFMETMEHDICSFSKLANQYGIQSDIMFVYQDEMMGDFSVGDTLFRIQDTAIDPQANLTVMVFRHHDSYRMSIEYRTELYSESLIESFAGVMDVILQGMLHNNSLKDMKLLRNSVYQQLEGYNRTETKIDLTRTIINQFREQVEKTPDHIAVVYQDVRLTYRELDERTERIGQYIASLGIGPENVVAILVKRGENMPVCAIGALKSGAGYQPLDATYPPERLQFMISDSDAGLLIADEDLLHLLPDYQGKVLLTKDIETLPNGQQKLPEATPENLFIMLYTSGSTGVPKGCMLENRNITCFIEWYKKYNQITEDSVVAQYASFGFDACMMDMYPTLTSGARLVIIGEDIRLNLVELDQYFEQEQVTIAFMTTQVGRFMAENMKNRSMRYLAVGGEKLVPVEKKGDFTFSNVYGPTETTILTTACPITEDYTDVPIGRALDNFKLYVVDAQGRMLPPGMPGELWISGPQVSRGYLNRPEQTEKAYTSNPFTDQENYERVYHTGDIVRYMCDGNLQFIGRRDAQVKIRGFRIELSEVEGVVREYPGIKDATVAAFDDPSGGKYIAAYVVSDEKVDVQALNEFILERKPPYIVPAVTMQLDKIPLNQNYKVNKRALPIPERVVEEMIAPENEMQQKIFDFAAKAIGNDQFGITTDLYYAGLTSIGAIKLNGWLSDEFDRVIKNSDLKAHNTIRSLEEFLLQGAEKETFEASADYPLTQTQMGIFVECAAHPDTTIYNIPILLKLSDHIDADRFVQAVQAAVNAHPYVKMRLMMNDDGDIRARRLDADESFEVIRIDAGHLDEVKDQLVEPFHILGGSLIRAKLIQAEQLYFFIEMHHIISDGTSLQIFLNDISKAYQGETLEIERFTGFENALSEEKARKGEVYQQAKAYYTGLFDGCDAECMPISDIREKLSAQTDQITTFGEAVCADDVKKFCVSHGLTMNAFFTTAFGILISKFCRKDDAIFTTIYNGRSDSRLQNTVSMLVKTYPVICSVADGEQSPIALINGIKQQLMNSMTNDIYSFAEIRRAFDIRADIMFAYQGDEFGFDTLCGENCEMLDLKLDQTKAPVNVNVFLVHGKIKYFCEYAANLYSKAFMEGFLAAFEQIIHELMMKSRIRDISIMSESAKEKIASFNDNEAEVNPMLPSQLFEKQAAAQPDKRAVTAAGRELTFGELNCLANRVAHSLIEKAAGAEVIVGLMLHRTVDVYAVREGILKSGAAFLSIEPDYPDERITYILEDSGAKFFITTGELYEARKELLDACHTQILLLEDLYQCSETSNPVVDVKPENLAYCIYTSGSTGKPKGVMIERRNLMNMLNDSENNILARDYIDNTTVFLGLAAITFDVSVIEEMMPLYHGQTVAMATEEEIHNPIALADMMLETGVDMMKCTPSFMLTIMDAPRVQEALRKLKAIIIGAEAFPKGLYEKMRGIGMEGIIFNSYGPTETTVTVTIDQLDGKNITIGRPCNNVKVLMLDRFDQILPPGAPGELTIVGKSVGRGYIGLPQMTAEKFIQFHGENAYRSGDIAYWNQDGKIEFCGRSDNQVKLRGLRVEIDEIENVMNTYPSIKRSVVLVKENSSGQYLCGYYTAVEKVDQAKLTEHLAKSLTNYMIPNVFVELQEMPMNKNGKIDKKALPEPELAAAREVGKEPVTELEKLLCEIFSKAIGIDSIGVDDDFFEMGGTSLSASKVAMKCMMEKLPVVYANIFDYATVEKLADFIEVQNGKTEAERRDEIKLEILTDNEQDNPYAKAQSMLRHNTVQYIDEIHEVPIGNVLLTGATGFLGIHVLRELLNSNCEKIYCLVRKGNLSSPTEHLKMLLMYYFDETFDAYIDRRISVLSGDITDPGLKEMLKEYHFDTVINCAACVKHFTQSDILERVNVKGVENLIDLCKSSQKRLVQISTVSVAGFGEEGVIPPDKQIHENELYFGQNLENKYAESKFRAETKVLEAVADGLQGKIVRVGNLMSRYEDGEFQINFITNGFMNRLQAYAAIGQYPVNTMDARAEFSPIDKTAQAIVRLAGTPDEFTVFHAYNCHTVHMANVLYAMKQCGIEIAPVEAAEFQNTFHMRLEDEKTNMKVSALVSYLSNDRKQFVISRDNEFTTKALYRLGFAWPLIDEDYLEKTIRALLSLGFFDE